MWTAKQASLCTSFAMQALFGGLRLSRLCKASGKPEDAIPPYGGFIGPRRRASVSGRPPGRDLLGSRLLGNPSIGFLI
jgi:hypothetical protein